MAEIPKDMKFMLFGFGARWHAKCTMALNFLALASFIVGIISAALGNALGLGATNWLLIAIALWLWDVWSWLTAYRAAKEGIK
jgi:hypothetical protein